MKSAHGGATAPFGSTGEVGVLMRVRDWSDSPIGHPDTWPQTLKTAVGVVLPAKAQIVLFWGPEFVALYNDAYAATIGDKHPRALGRPARENWAELWDDLEPLLRSVRETAETVFAKDRPFYIERHGYGETVYFDISYSPVWDETGAVGGVLCIVGETTQRVVTDKALQEREAHLSALIGQATVGISECDEQGRFLFANDRYCELVGRSRDQLLGLRVHDITHPDDRARNAPLLRRAAETGESYEIEKRYVRPDGSVVWVITNASRLQVSGDGGARILRVSVDISDRKAAEERLRELNDELESRVIAEIENRRQAELALQQAQKMEAIGKLTGGIAHDFNNLLQIIVGNLQLLESDLSGNDRAERRIRNARKGADRAAQLTGRLLAFARRQPLEPTVVNAARLVRGMSDMLQRALGEAIEIETFVAEDLWNCYADPGQIENAVLNLAINARDAMDGRGRLTIEIENASLDADYARINEGVEPGDYVMLAVSDTGCGMAPDLIERVFEPFFTTKPEGKGSGLGLSMVYGFAKQSGGHLKIYSEIGQGTTVKLYLPRSGGGEADETAGKEPERVAGGSELVLVVEDDDDVRANAVEVLKGLGYATAEAASAEEALAILEGGAPIDLLFIDVVMPGTLRTPELARRARELRPDMAVLFTSGYTEDAIVHGGRLEQGVQLIGKPYTREELAQRIRRALDSAKTA